MFLENYCSEQLLDETLIDFFDNIEQEAEMLADCIKSIRMRNYEDL
ncbi:hypothetical protein QJU23_03655 [Pasteurella atlantica]|uniref:Uncharacterized protein n=2 Tax=Pasteurellaceae TaxID=712 RepID=A0ACC6HKX0_9PAST|nr:hypothetical protein [Pasteurella atlantica]MDP8051522.1 hypothetical protein [Pasteurella atlantica]MDP8104899.1 hypothetical protein [Pasteurella atlantica]MDP8148273.1 hypothetical protein [Pasteurella atlantica]